ncbi:MAG: ABC transporter permease [Arhodomonas sp.]|nr:ABC transporter permease [Arhodomonas sp.]
MPFQSPQRLFYGAALVAMFALGIWTQGTGFVDDFLFYWPDITYLLRQHIMLMLISGGLAIAFAVPVGVVLTRPRFARLAESAMQVLNVGQTIPTLAVLALSMTLLGIGTVPAIFALFVYTILPIARNTYAGIKSVPDHMKEAAAGMGMSPMQMLFRVELPNALFVIFAGIRTALAVNVGTVPLAFLIGGAASASSIFTGIAMDDTVMMLAGAIPTALLAVVVDMVVATLAFLLVPKGVNPLRNPA